MPDRAGRPQLLETPRVIINPYRFVPPSAQVWIVDNADAGCVFVGTWGTHPGGYGGDYRASPNSSPGSRTVTWTLTGLDAGTYRVSITWVPFTNRATNSPFSVYDNATLRASYSVNQELAPDADYTEGGVDFKTLGDHSITSGTVRVRLTNSANEYVIADAIRVEKVG